MNNKLTFASVLFFLNLGNQLIFGQQNVCGTIISESQRMLENTWSITDEMPQQSLPQVNRTLSFSVFVVKDEDGTVTDAASINNAMDQLSRYFAPVALKFKVCGIQVIDNYQFNDLYQGGNEKDLLVQYNVPGTINLYLVKNLFDQSNNSTSGFTYMPGDKGKHAIFLQKSYLTGTTLAHQTGHFFNLYHTHESEAFGAELVNESNCSTSGDRVCDTNADPNVMFYMQDGVYTGTEKDLNKEIYSPSPRNIMSYGPDITRCVFTRGQFLRMIYCLSNFRKELR